MGAKTIVGLCRNHRIAWLILLLSWLVAANPGLANDNGPPIDGAMVNFTVKAPTEPAPNVTFADAEENERQLEEFRGKLLLINFWATWCGPCRHEMRSLDQLQAELGGAEFQVLAIAADRQGLAKVADFYAEEDIVHLEKYVDPSTKSQRQFRALGLPTTVLVSAEGEELGRLVGPADWAGDDALSLIQYYLARPTG